MADHLSLKWGTLKGWKLDKPESKELIRRYVELGASFSAMAQQDTDEQKKLLRELIEQHDGTISNDWSGETYTKEQALDYLEIYGKVDP